MQKLLNQTFSLKKLCLLIFICLTPQVFSQTGSIDGKIVDKITKETLLGASVSINGSSTGTVTDMDGHYTISKLKPGKYQVKVSYVSYNPFISGDIEVKEGDTTVLNIELISQTVHLEGVKIVGIRNTGSDISVLRTMKSSDAVVSVVSSQLISRLQDRDAADVVKRIPGITVIDDKFIIVRGLSQRYNNVWLNNAATPSSEADTKAFSFDVVPSSMIENIMVFKSFSADLPADFSGGFIKIATRAIPDQNSFQLSYSSSVNEGTTFRNFNKYDGSSTDWLGYDNGLRSLPAGMPSNLNDYENASNPKIQDKVNELGKAMNKTWLQETNKAPVDQRFSIGINRRFDIGQSSLGNITAINYSNTYNQDFLEQNNRYTIYDYKNDNPSFNDQFRDHQYTNTARIGILHNWSIYLNQKNSIDFRNLFNQIGSTKTTDRFGQEFYNDGRFIRSVDLSYMSRSIYSGQLGGLHLLKDDKYKVDWTLGYSLTNKKEPDIKRYRYILNDNNYILKISDPTSISRMWLNLEETLMSGALNITHPVELRNSTMEWKAGVYIEKKKRTFDSRNFWYNGTGDFATTTMPIDSVFRDVNFNKTNGIRIYENSDKANSYTAGNQITSGYLTVKLPVLKKINLHAGLRIEKSNQYLHSYKNGTNTKVDPVRDTLNLFPSLNLSYNFNDKNLIRLAYGKTVNRPEFREMAPFYFVDFDLNAGVQGNDSIKQAYVQSFDIRYEAYPSTDEVFSLGLFYKQFSNAIEFTILGNNPTLYSFANVKTAYSYGAELELRKSLQFIGLKNFAVLFNGSLIQSKISVEGAYGNALNRDRPLQGQSPYIVNAGLFYQDEKGLQVNVIYNIIGDRIVAVGRPSPNKWEDIPDVYESPRNLIDFTISKKIGRTIELKGGIKDLLNEKVELYQRVNTDVDMSRYQGSGTKHFNRKEVTKLYYPGRYFTLGLIFKI